MGRNKAAVNLVKHGADFRDVPRVFAGFVSSVLDTRDDYGEDRWRGMGMLNASVMVVVYTEPEENVIRVISFRKATKHEQRQFGSTLASTENDDV